MGQVHNQNTGVKTVDFKEKSRATDGRWVKGKEYKRHQESNQFKGVWE